MEGLTIVNLVILTALVSAACASRDALPTTMPRLRAERQQVRQRIVGPDSYTITPGQYSFVSLIQVITTRNVGASAPDSSQSEDQRAVARVCTGALITNKHVLTVAGCCWDESRKIPFSDVDITIAAHTLGPGGTKTVDSGQHSQGAVSISKTVMPDWVLRSFKAKLDVSMNAKWEICIINLGQYVETTTAFSASHATESTEAVPLNTKATFIGWGLQNPITREVVTQLRGINVTVIDCKYDDFPWVNEKWKDGKSIFICTEKITGGGCEGDAGD